MCYFKTEYKLEVPCVYSSFDIGDAHKCYNKGGATAGQIVSPAKSPLDSSIQASSVPSTSLSVSSSHGNYMIR